MILKKVFLKAFQDREQNSVVTWVKEKVWYLHLPCLNFTLFLSCLCRSSLLKRRFNQNWVIDFTSKNTTWLSFSTFSSCLLPQQGSRITITEFWIPWLTVSAPVLKSNSPKTCPLLIGNGVDWGRVLQMWVSHRGCSSCMKNKREGRDREKKSLWWQIEMMLLQGRGGRKGHSLELSKKAYTLTLDFWFQIWERRHFCCVNTQSKRYVV